jgi:hypothetical protein
MDALCKEMGALVVAFEMLEHGQNAPVGWFKATGHIILADYVVLCRVVSFPDLQTRVLCRRHVGDMSSAMSPTRPIFMSARVSKRHNI